MHFMALRRCMYLTIVYLKVRVRQMYASSDVYARHVHQQTLRHGAVVTSRSSCQVCAGSAKRLQRFNAPAVNM